MQNSLVAVFQSHKEAEDSLKDLQKLGFDMKKLSVIGRDHYSKSGIAAHYVVNQKPKFFGSPFWNYLPYDKGLFVVPGFGPFGVGGPLVAMIDDSLEKNEEEEEGFNIFNKALKGVGIPAEKIPEYQAYLGAEKYLLIVHGTPADIRDANIIIVPQTPLNIAIYDY